MIIFSHKQLLMEKIMSGENKKYRLVTRSDFDGLVCAVLFKDMDMIETRNFWPLRISRISSRLENLVCLR